LKYLKKFNEERSGTYLRASRKLSKLGHARRSKELETYGKSIEVKEQKDRWEKNIETYSKWGKVKIKFHKREGKKSNVLTEAFEGEFYLLLNFDDFAAVDNIQYDRERNPDFKFAVAFSVGIIPVDENVKELCDKHFPDNDFGNGFYWGMWYQVDYKIENERLIFNGISYNEYDESISLFPQFADRRGALTIKKILKAAVDENEDYPSGYDDVPNMHDKIFQTLCQKLELTADYNFTLDRVLSDIESVPHNTLFKD